MEQQIVGWWRRPQARNEHSSPTLPSPGGMTPNLSRRTLRYTCGVRGRGSNCPIAATWGWRIQATICRRCAAREGSCDRSHRGDQGLLFSPAGARYTPEHGPAFWRRLCPLEILFRSEP